MWIVALLPQHPKTTIIFLSPFLIFCKNIYEHFKFSYFCRGCNCCWRCWRRWCGRCLLGAGSANIVSWFPNKRPGFLNVVFSLHMATDVRASSWSPGHLCLHCTASLHYTELNWTAMNFTVLYCNLLHCTALHSYTAALHCITTHCESGEGLWLQGEAALQTHSFRDADPEPVNPKLNNRLWNIPQLAETRHKYQPDHHWPLSN